MPFHKALFRTILTTVPLCFALAGVLSAADPKPATAEVKGASPDGKAASSADPLMAEAPSILRDSDRFRGGVQQGLEWTVTLTSTEAGSTHETSYLVKASGNDALAECLAPARSRGELILFNDRTLWYYKPGLRKPVALSARQRLTGQAANGDIASTNYARDYEVIGISKDKVGEREAYKLELKARDRDTTYDRIRYWISTKERLGIKAEFLTLQEEVFKIATFEYGNSMARDGKTYPFVSRMRVVNATFPDDVTVIDYRAPKFQQHPASIFNINNLLR